MTNFSTYVKILFMSLDVVTTERGPSGIDKIPPGIFHVDTDSQQKSGLDRRPDWLLNIQTKNNPMGSLVVDGKSYKYTVVKAGLSGILPYIVGYPNDDSIFISEDAPEDYRDYILTHEIREKTKFSSLPATDRCRAALIEELNDVKTNLPDRYAGYLVSRGAFFDALVILYEDPQQRAAVTPEFIQAISTSRDYLRSLNNDSTP